MTHFDARLEEVYADFLAHFAPDNHLRRAGAVAAFTGPDSPLTTVKGLRASAREDDLAAIEEFLFDRGAARVVIEAPPWFPAELLIARGYSAVDTENVLARTVEPCELPVGVEALADPGAWTALQSDAFASPLEGLWPVLHALPGALNLGIREKGSWVAAAQSISFGDVALFACDGTHPEARGRGYQTAIIQARLHHAARLEHTWATAEVAPGSGSERNYLRAGFRRAYQRTHFARSRGAAAV